MGAAFKAARRRSTKIHFQEAARRRIEAGFPALTPAVCLHIKNAVRSATRGLSPPKLKPAFRLEDLSPKELTCQDIASAA